MPRRRPLVARFSTAIGIVVAVAAGAFVAHAIIDQWASVRESLSRADAWWLAAGLLGAAAAMVAIALPWRRALQLVGVDAARLPALLWYFVGEIGKYVPGAIWPVVGRAELARRGGHPRSAAYMSVALSLGALYLSAMLVAAMLVPLRWLDEMNDSLWVLVLLPLGILALHHRPLGWMIGRAEHLLKRKLTVQVPAWSASMGLILRYVPSWLLVGTATWFIAKAFEPNVGWVTIAPAAILSWVVGFVFLPVPGGVGVREAAFVALVGGTIPSGTRAAIAIAARLAFMVADAGGAAICALGLRRWHPSFPSSDTDASGVPPASP